MMENLGRATNPITCFNQTIESPANPEQDQRDLRQANMLLKEKAYAQAYPVYERLANTGNLIALYGLGMMHHFGWHVPKDYQNAMGYYKKAADGGVADAWIKLGDMYRDGLGVDIVDDVEAMRCYQKAADGGVADAWIRLGEMYRDGRGTGIDYVEAMRCFREAIDRGSFRAWNHVGLMYIDGQGVEIDHVEAMRCFKEATDHNCVYGWTNMGGMYQDGLGVPVNTRKALRCYKEAADRGFAPAWIKMAGIYGKFMGGAWDTSAAAYCNKMSEDVSEKTEIANRIKQYEPEFQWLRSNQELINILEILRRHCNDFMVRQFSTGKISLEDCSSWAPWILTLFKNSPWLEVTKSWFGGSESHYLSSGITKVISDLLDLSVLDIGPNNRVKFNTLQYSLLIGKSLHFKNANLRGADLCLATLRPKELIGIDVRGAKSDDPAVQGWVKFQEEYWELFNGHVDPASALHVFPLEVINTIGTFASQLKPPSVLK